jgi:glycosyltransferase involved in cell wall biosynthesis
MRLAVLHHSLTGYWNICLRNLHAQGDASIFVAHRGIDPNTPFDSGMFSWIDEIYDWDQNPDADRLLERVQSFRPNILLILGWHFPAYRRIARAMKGKSDRVLYFDNAWRGTPKQWLGVMTSGLHVRPIADYAWVPGDRQREFARRLGFRELQIIEGSLSGDSTLFASVPQMRSELPVRPRAFLFVGRLVSSKGVFVLLDGYAKYRSQCGKDPWPLICAGAGPMVDEATSREGVVMRGFLQPQELAQAMAQASVFVLPSLFEPWAVVVHEAATAGMPIIVSEAVGSHVHLVQSGFNGYIVDTGSEESLANTMLRFHMMEESTLAKMGKASEQLAQQYTPSRWAATLRRIAARSHA